MSRIVVFAALLAAAGCAEPEAPTLSVRAEMGETLYDGEAVRVRHEEIPGVMPAMEMPLAVDRPDLLDGLAVGDPVRLTLDSASFRVLAVEPLPAGTALDLEPDTTGAFVPGVPVE